MRSTESSINMKTGRAHDTAHTGHQGRRFLREGTGRAQGARQARLRGWSLGEGTASERKRHADLQSRPSSRA